MTHKDAGQAGSGEPFFDVQETHAKGWTTSTVRYTWTQLLDTFEEGCLTRVIMDSHASLSAENATLREQRDAMAKALEIIRPHVDLGQARLNGSYCAAKIDEHTFCGRGRQWPGHRSDAKEWPEHEFVDAGALVAALSLYRKGP